MDAALSELVERLGNSVRTDLVTCQNYRFDWARDPAAGTRIAAELRSEIESVSA